MLVRASTRTPLWKQQLGRVFRIGYYSEQDGFDAIWLVNEEGEYEQTLEPRDLLQHFVVLSLSDEIDLVGVERPPFGRLGAKDRKRHQALRASVAVQRPVGATAS